METLKPDRPMQIPVHWILSEVAKRTAGPRPLLVAIDGRCAAGKTTLAAALRRACGCAVVHLDDFFLRPEQRTRNRYDTPGGNIDHERFLEQVLLPLSQGAPAIYRPFDCSSRRLLSPVRVEHTTLVVAEGAYACHPELSPYYDLKVFLTVSAGEQVRRIRSRNGPQAAHIFRTRWIPLEERYFAAYHISDHCDRCFDTTEAPL